MLYIKIEYSGDWWGEDPLTETAYDNTGDLFRALSGRNPERPWEALGRCIGKVYVDGPDGPEQRGWVFVARNPEPVNRGDTQPTGLRVAWVTVYDRPPEVTRFPHHFGRA